MGLHIKIGPIEIEVDTITVSIIGFFVVICVAIVSDVINKGLC